MNVVINGQPLTIPDGLTVRSLLEHLEFTAGLVAVEINRAIVPRAEHHAAAVREDDANELVQLVGGG